MKKTALIFLILAVISTMLIAGCTQVQTLPAPTPAVTPVPTYVENQQGVAIIRTATAVPTPLPTTAVPVATPPTVTDPALIGTWNYNGAMLATGGSGVHTRAVSISTGIRLPRSRICRRTSKPLAPGSITSSTASACSPERARSMA